VVKVSEKEKSVRRAMGLVTHHKDQLDALRRDLPKEVMYTEKEIKEMQRAENSAISRSGDGKRYWLGGVELRKKGLKLWIWKNPYYDKEKGNKE
jgi:hypothetical protein